VTDNPKILILTGSYGNGHIQVTKTITESLKNKGFTNTVVSDLFLEAHPIITTFTKYLYIKSYTYGQKLYGLFYYGINNSNNHHIDPNKKSGLISMFGLQTLINLVNKVKPDIIVNTFPMQVVPEFKKKTGAAIPIVNIVTDFCLHQNWIHNNIDRYYVATEELAETMKQFGIANDKIRVTGIPVKQNFERYIPTGPVYDKYHLNSKKPIILIFAGAYGVLKDVGKVVSHTYQKGNNQVVVVCGSNKKLQTSLESQFIDCPDIKILGYTNKIHELMKISTIMVTKPGGITLSEALTIQVPIILYRSVPGQERENASYFEQKGMAINTYHDGELIDYINQLVNDTSMQQRMKENMRNAYQRNAADRICEDIINQFMQTKALEKRIGESQRNENNQVWV
jgi:processive 1,2-diacylglycerol beta-glucosyltransferase